MRGGNVCRMHGGGAPQVRRRAQERILAAADTAAARLIEFMNDRRVPWPVRLTAARDLLDRAGLNAKTTVEVEVPVWARGLDELVVDGIVSEQPSTGVQDAPELPAPAHVAADRLPGQRGVPVRPAAALRPRRDVPG